jgi:hypothetical protein
LALCAPTKGLLRVSLDIVGADRNRPEETIQMFERCSETFEC